jgi:CubicO group peptidase (beta-lactamase class C family)
MKRREFGLSLGAAALGASVGRAAPAEGSTVVAGALGRRLDEYLTRLEGFGYSGAALVVRRGAVVLRRGYGLADVERGIANAPETVFDVGSISKPFTAAAVLALEEAGKLGTSDPIGRYLPSAPPDKARVTIHQLLTHTGGMAPWAGINVVEISRDEALGRIFGQPLLFEPGSQFRYSNSGYTVLAAVVEAAAGEPYRDYLQRRLFERAGLRSTGFWGARLPRVDARLVARGYDELGVVGDPTAWSATSFYGVGSTGITSTVLDLHRWHLAMRGDRVLSAASRRKMLTPVMPSAKPSDGYHSSDYGYGWFVQKTPGGRTRIQHGGDSRGFGAQSTFYVEDDLVSIVTCNVRHDWFPTVIKASLVLPKIALGEPYASPPAFLAGRPPAPERLVGTYALASGGRLVVDLDRGQLRIGADGQDAADAIVEADEAEARRRAELSAKARAIFEGTVKGDFTTMAAALPPDDDIGFWRDGWPDEMRAIVGGKGAFRSLDVLGTVPSGRPDFWITVLRYNFEHGSTPYRVVWREKYFGGSDVRSPALAAHLPLRAESRATFVGWRIWDWDDAPVPLRVTFDVGRGAATGLTLRRGDRTWTAKRVATLALGRP